MGIEIIGINNLSDFIKRVDFSAFFLRIAPEKARRKLGVG